VRTRLGCKQQKIQHRNESFLDELWRGLTACEIEIVCADFFANCCNGRVMMEGCCRNDRFLPLQGLAKANMVAE